MITSGPKKRRPKGPFILLLILLVLVGSVFFLSNMASEQPVETIEEEVSLDADAQ